MEEKYKTFRDRIYSNLVAYKVKHITDKSGTYKGVEYSEFLPEVYWNDEIPVMLYHGIRETVADIQKGKFKYKPHIFANKHVASSQTACVNLFVPIMESESVNDMS